MSNIKYEELKVLLKEFLMNHYDIRPSLAERTVDHMFLEAVNFISIEDQYRGENRMNVKEAENVGE